MKSSLMCLLAVCILGISGCAGIVNPEAEKAAITAAESWLALIDGAQYGDSWEASAALLKSSVSKEKWGEMIKSVREPIGGIVSREVNASSYRTSLPGAPDGEYVVIQFKAVYENKKEALETVTPMKDTDGIWRVSGYYIK